MEQGAAAPWPLTCSCGKGCAPVRSAASFVWDGIKGKQPGWGEEEPWRGLAVFGVTCALPVCQELCFLPVQLVLIFDIRASGLAMCPCEAEWKLSGCDEVVIFFRAALILKPLICLDCLHLLLLDLGAFCCTRQGPMHRKKTSPLRTLRGTRGAGSLQCTHRNCKPKAPASSKGLCHSEVVEWENIFINCLWNQLKLPIGEIEEKILDWSCASNKHHCTQCWGGSAGAGG